MAIRLSVHAAQGLLRSGVEGEPESSVHGRMPASEVQIYYARKPSDHRVLSHLPCKLLASLIRLIYSGSNIQLVSFATEEICPLYVPDKEQPIIVIDAFSL
jgi:hypothetical protein